jgi:serine/threonine protein kinase
MQPGTLVADKYRVERIIGRGGMGLVAEATHVGLGNRVALKFLAEDMASDQTALARFRREAQAAAQLRSEHVCRVFDVGVEGKTPFIVMELLQGTDLARLSKVRALDPATAALYVKQACVGLAEAHAAKIVHRDLKPGNLFLTRRADGSPLIKVLDFGVAKAPSDDDVKLTGTANVVGSPGFMSPEQFRSSRTVDGRSDVWSLGVILYKLVSGRLPFKGDGFAEFALAITRDAVPPLGEAPSAFQAVVARCLEKDPAHRYPDVLALADALAPIAAHARSSAPELSAELPSSDEISSGIGSAPDSGAHTLLLGAAPQRAPAQRAPAPVAAPAAAKQTMIGVSQAQQVVTSAPTPNLRTIESAVPAAPAVTAPGTAAARHVATMPGTAVGDAERRYVPAGELPRGTVVGEYRIDDKIGEGGMGIVYSATHPMIGKRAAIKVISAELGTDPVLVQRFVQEARSVNQIGHPNIVDVFAFGKLPDDRNYFVMEYLQGESLRGRLTRSFMSIADAVQILDEVAGALEAAHEQGIVHRDLKPDNVYLASVRGGYIIVKLLDFGIAKLVTDGGIAKTSTGEMMGTPGYLSPEQARGKNVDYRTDIYALGCMMFEMVTGRTPFMGESPMDIVMMHITTAPARPSMYKPDMPPLIEQLILEMLEKDPDKRPSLAYVRNVFAELVASGTVTLEPGSNSTFRSDLARRRPDSEMRTPGSNTRARPGTPTPAPPIAAAGRADPHTVRRRNVSPSDAPTQIAFTPGPATLAPSPAATTIPHARPPTPSRRGRVLAIVIGAALVPAVAIAVAVMKTKPGSAVPHDAAVTTQAIADPASGDAAVEPSAITETAVAPDASVIERAAPDVTIRDVEIRIDVPGAKLTIDGKPFVVTDGFAHAPLEHGKHRVVVTASGHRRFDRTIDVTSTLPPLTVRLAPSRAAGQGSAVGSGSAADTKDYTLDPFAN